MTADREAAIRERAAEIEAEYWGTRDVWDETRCVAVLAGAAARVDAELAAAREREQTLREAAGRVVGEYHKWSEDANDGEFAIWREEDFINAIIGLRAALAAAEEQA